MSRFFSLERGFYNDPMSSSYQSTYYTIWHTVGIPGISEEAWGGISIPQWLCDILSLNHPISWGCHGPPHGVVMGIKWDKEGIAPEMSILCSSPLGCWNQSLRLCSREPVSLLYSSGFQIAFPGASGSCSHESEAEGEGEKNRGREKLSRWDLIFLPQVHRSSSAVICLRSWGDGICKEFCFWKGLETTLLFYNHRVLPNMPARCCVKGRTNENISMLIG